VRNWAWFISSYAPLWAMFALRFEDAWLRVFFALLAGFGVLVAVVLLRRGRRERPSNTPITVTGDAGSEVSGYLAAYLLPFLTVAAPSLVDGVAYFIFFMVAGVVYVRSGLMQINPTVYLLRRKVVRGSTPAGHDLQKEVFVITSLDRRVGEKFRGERFSDRVYIDHATG
jgi:hypothetical protein